MTLAAHHVWTVRPARTAPVRTHSRLAAWRHALFGGPASTIATLVCGALLLGVGPAIIDWALIGAVWDPTAPAACATADGACWAIVAEKHRVMLFGAFPFDQHWRAALACLVILGGAIFSAVPRFWSWRLAVVWAALLTVVMWLMLGGAGLAPTRADDWGGLPLTLILFAGSVTGGLPLAIMLALGRYSRLPVLRLLCVGFIEIFRGLPLLAVLFMASLMLPLVLGDGITIGKVARAMLAMTLFFAAYAAEIVRGGLQALPRGQTEAAQSVGLSYWQMMALVILPQALKLVAPALVNDIIRAFKNTSFVAVIGLFDLLGATRAAIEDPQWVRYALETYLFLILVYFLFCSSMSAYARWIERRIDVDRPVTARTAP